MRITERSGLGAVAVAVGDALRRHGIKAVLSGGACASLYTRGAFQSADMDFILTGPAKQSQLDAAMATLGFTRKGDRYVRRRTRFYVEFPRGPLAIGNDFDIRPVTRRTPHGRAVMLSPTDSCRDRLAAFYHWNDRQSLQVAVWIVRRGQVHLPAVRRWSVAEGFADRFEEFLAEVKRARARSTYPGRRPGAGRPRTSEAPDGQRGRLLRGGF